MTRFNRAVWRIMPPILRKYFIGRMCERYGCTIWKSPYWPNDFDVDVWYKSERGSRWVGSVNPRDYWEDIEKVIVECSVIGTFR